MNREHWLTEVAQKIKPLFGRVPIEPFRVTCGWPSEGGLSNRARRLGECWGPDSSSDGTHEIFISPTLEDSLEVAGTLCHEITHVAAGIEAGHAGQFIRLCKYIGLTKGRPKSVMPGQRLNENLVKLVDGIGSYPHKAMKLVQKENDKPPGEKTKTVYCAGCDCRLSIKVKYLEACGLPTCGCGTGMGLKE